MKLRALNSWLYTHCSTRNILLSFIVTFSIIAAFRSSLPMTDTALRAVSGQGILDVQFNHSSRFVIEQIEAYTDSGRSIYQRFIALDLIFVFAYGFAFSLLISRLTLAWHSHLNLVPWLASISDLTENCCHLLLLKLYPTSSMTIAAIATSATRFKYVFIALSFVALIVAFIQFIKSQTRSH